MRNVSPERGSFLQTAAVYLVTLASLALLGGVLAYWTWAWAAPRPIPRAQMVPEPSGQVEIDHLFGIVRSNLTGPSPTSIAIRLLGVVADSSSGKGYAVVQLHSKDIVAVHEGQEVASGIRLTTVRPDHVVLERNGVRETLAWAQKTTPAKSATR